MLASERGHRPIGHYGWGVAAIAALLFAIVLSVEVLSFPPLIGLFAVPVLLIQGWVFARYGFVEMMWSSWAAGLGGFALFLLLIGLGWAVSRPFV